MGTKNNPGAFDCYANAEADEPMFILLARDASAPALVRAWAFQREAAIDSGLKPLADREMAAEARTCAAAMENWRRTNRPEPPRGFARFASAEGWEGGAPDIGLFGNAIQVWSLLQHRPVTVAEAAAAFRVAPHIVIEAVEAHAWMFLTGKRTDPDRLSIEHEGE